MLEELSIWPRFIEITDALRVGRGACGARNMPKKGERGAVPVA
jgi:hypothetical protein